MMKRKQGRNQKRQPLYDPHFEQWKATWQSMIEGSRAAIQFAVLVIRSLLIINGGAIVVLMALLGSLWAGLDNIEGMAMAAKLGLPFKRFAVGLVFAVATGMMAYLSQILASEHPENKTAFLWAVSIRLAAILAAITSLLFFIMGSNAALKVFGVTSPLP